ncbi:MAG: hypothetical protein AAGC54_15920, partial [Cyanobacteria bacterium P01_F01_bin.4]
LREKLKFSRWMWFKQSCCSKAVLVGHPFRGMPFCMSAQLNDARETLAVGYSGSNMVYSG